MFRHSEDDTKYPKTNCPSKSGKTNIFRYPLRKKSLSVPAQLLLYQQFLKIITP